MGNRGVDNYYAPGGKLILGCSNGSIRYNKRDDRLQVKIRSQSYYLAKGPSGEVLHVPDFQRPFGTLFEVEYQSDPVILKK